MRKIIFTTFVTLFYVLSSSVVWAVETIQEEAIRRIPPVLRSLAIPDKLVSGQTYTINWSVIGYENDYKTIVVFFDCTDKTPPNCGNSYSDSKLAVSGKLTSTLMGVGEWGYLGSSSATLNYTYTFTPSVTTKTETVIRFYYIGGMDDANSKNTISLMAPGNLENVLPYDTSGRRLATTILPIGALTAGAPTISPASYQTVNQDGSLSVSLSMDDLETPLHQLNLSASSSNQTLVPNNKIYFGTDRKLTIVPIAGQYGSTSITVKVLDSDGNITSSTVELTIPQPPSTHSGDQITLNSSLGEQMASYFWSQVSGEAVVLDDENIATPSFLAPEVTESQDLVFHVMAVDHQGNSYNSYVTIVVNPPRPPQVNFALDTTFGTAGLVTTDIDDASSDSANRLAIQADGKMVVAGTVYKDNASRVALTRYNSDGSLDTTFGTDGKAISDIITYVYAVAIQPDGKIVVNGSSRMVRFNSDGSVDTTFNGVEKAINVQQGTVVIQPDGKIVEAGYVQGVQWDFALVRYNSDGSYDTSFGTVGTVTTDFGASRSEVPKTVVLLEDGKIVVGGQSYDNDGGELALARYNSDGSLDATFDSDGMVTTHFYGRSDQVTSLAILDDGKMLAGGYLYNNNDSYWILIRYNSDGSLDDTFGSNGTMTYPSSSSSSYPLNSMIVQDDGRIVMGGGYYYSDSFLVRFNSDGSFDTSSGIAVGHYVSDIKAKADGSIVVVGAINNDFALASYLSPTVSSNYSSADISGLTAEQLSNLSSVQISFLTTAQLAGLTTEQLGSLTLDQLSGLGSIQFDSLTLIQLGGLTATQIASLSPKQISNLSDPKLDILTARLGNGLNNGLDVTFGVNGKVTTSMPGSSGTFYAEDITIQTDGKLIVGGQTDGDFTLVRYESDGSLDTSLDGDGIVITDFGSSNDQAYSLALQTDGKIVLAGRRSSPSDVILARYNSDGSLDSTFGVDGKVSTDIAGDRDYGKALAIQVDGKIVLGGYSYASPGYKYILVRYNSDGSLDATFDSDGKVITDISDTGADVNAIAIQSDGKILLAGSASSDFSLVRYNSDGSLDTTFSEDGKVVTDILGGYDNIQDFAIHADGKIITVGQAYSGVISTPIALVRYNGDGSLDATFGDSGIITTSLSGSDSSAYGLAVLDDGKIIVGGYVYSYSSSQSNFALVRYNSDGSLDTTFDEDGMLTINLGLDQSGYARAFDIQDDGKIVLGGRSNSPYATDAQHKFTMVRIGSPIGNELVTLHSPLNSVMVSYAWIQTSGSTVTLDDADTATPTFTTPVVTETEILVFQLTAVDSQGTTYTSDVSITVQPGSKTPQTPQPQPISVVSIAKTGQVYNHTAGGDGALQKGVVWPEPRFTNNGDGSITDQLTGLTWLANANCFDPQAWSDALASANTLASGACGLSDGSAAEDWRLPSVKELKSLIDYGRNNPALPEDHLFTNVQSSKYWSSSTNAGPINRWTVDLATSHVNGHTETDTYYVLPVRGEHLISATAAVLQSGQTESYGTRDDGALQQGIALSDARFTDLENGTIKDEMTGLIWLKDANCFSVTKTWADALSTASGLADGTCGLSDGSVIGEWRIPNQNELSMLVHYGHAVPSLLPDHPFANVQFNYYWSNTTNAANPKQAWRVYFNDGRENTMGKTSGNYAWPVKGGVGNPVTMGGALITLDNPFGDQMPDNNWTQTGGTEVELSDPNAATPSFTVPVVTDTDGLEFNLVVVDVDGETFTATEEITVEPGVQPNIAPKAYDESLQVNENEAKSSKLGADDIDADVLTFSIVSNGTKGTAVITDTATGDFTYTPNADTSGIDSFTFKVNDGELDSLTATISVDITIVSSTTIYDFTINEDTSSGPIAFTVGAARVPIANLGILASSSNATLVPEENMILNGTGASWTITIIPAPNLYGDTTITITVGDGIFITTQSFTLTVVPIEDAPISPDRTFATNWSGPFSGQFVASDAEGDTITFEIASNPVKGSVVLADAATGAFTYTPDAGMSGEDSFTYRASDGKATPTVSTVTFSDTFAPVIRTGQTSSYVAGDDGALQKGVAWPDSRFLDNSDGTITDNLTGLIWMQNGNCWGTLNWRSAFVQIASLNSGTASCADYTGTQADWRMPNRQELDSLVDFGRSSPALPSGHPFSSVQSSYWSSSIVAGASSNAWLVNLGGYGQSSTKPQSDSYTIWPVRAGIPATVAAAAPTINTIADLTSNEDVAASVTVAVGASRTALDNVIIQASSSDTTIVPNSNILITGSGADRNISLIPVTDISGSTTITVTVSDGVLSSSESFVLTVVAVNDAPMARDRTFATNWGGTLSNTLAATDAEGDAISYALVSNPSKGSVSLMDAVTGAFTYTPNSGESGEDSFTYKANDGNADSNTATVTVSDTFAPVVRTGQTSSYVAGDDGALQKGLAWPDSRFTDNGDGTITDNLSGLTWMQNSNCWGTLNWSSAFVQVADLNSGTAACTGYSGNSADWRVPNRNELDSLVDFGRSSPALPSGHPFTTIQSSYWSSSIVAGASSNAWLVNLGGYGQSSTKPNGDSYTIWPVRGGVPATVAAAAPTISTIVDLSSNEDVSASVTLTVGATRTALDNVIVQTSSSDTSVVPNNNIVMSGTGADRTISLIPATDVSGSTTITVTITDGALSTSTSFVLTVVAVNDAPDAPNKTFAMDWSGPLTGTLAATDAEGDSVTHSIVSYPIKGTVTLTDTATGAFTYTPNSGESGEDSFTYQANDGNSDSTVATVTVSDTFAPVVRTGQTSSYVAGDDGALQKGVVWPDSRFTDNSDGSITDNLTGLTWMQNGNCFGVLDWYTALVQIAELNTGTASCTGYSGSDVDWRMPNRHELDSLVDYGKSSPALPTGHPFTSVQSSYWSSSVVAGSSSSSWLINLGGYGQSSTKPQSDSYTIWPVRGGR